MWRQELRGQVAMVTEDHWERTEILRRALDFHKTWNWREELFVHKLALYMEGGKRPKKEANHSRLVSGNFNKQGHLIYEAISRQVDLHTLLPESSKFI